MDDPREETMKNTVKLEQDDAGNQLPTVFLIGVAFGASVPLMLLAFG